MRRLETFRKLYEEGLLTQEKIQESINGWMAYAEWGDTYKLRKKLNENLFIPAF